MKENLKAINKLQFNNVLKGKKAAYYLMRTSLLTVKYGLLEL